MNNGWIKLHRKLLENPISKKSNYFSLWVTLLLLANHKKNNFIWNNKTITIKTGQILTGRKKLSKQTGIPETTIERILAFLENGQQIRQQKTTKYRIITILKWDSYQTSDNKRTTSGQQTDTNKNDKNEKNNTIATKVADVPFNSKNWIEQCCASKQEHIRLIGNYMKIKKMDFPSKRTAEAELRRNTRPAMLLTDYSSDRRKRAMIEADRATKQWTLETVLKFLNKQNYGK